MLLNVTADRRIRVHTLCIPVTSSLQELLVSADHLAVAGLLSKMGKPMHTVSTVVLVFATFCCYLAAVDKSLQYSLSDAREALVNSAIDMLNAYSGTLTSSQQMGALLCPPNMRLLPLLVLALLKFVSLWMWKVDRLIFNICSV